MKAADESVRDNEQRNDSPPEPLFVTAAELAQLMRISTRTLWRLLSAHKIPEPIRLGGAVRWRIDVIQDWIDQGCPAQNE
jgi:predicted DNA-binding transcriptional regulator AlpA